MFSVTYSLQHFLINFIFNTLEEHDEKINIGVRTIPNQPAVADHNVALAEVK